MTPCLRGFLAALLIAWSNCLPGNIRAAALPDGFAQEDVAGPWEEVVGLAFAPGDKMYVWERVGRVWVVENGVKNSTPFLDISDEVGGWLSFGLLGFALDPNFATNGYVYLLYVVDRHHLRFAGTPDYNPNANEYIEATIGRITRYTARASDGFRSVDPASRVILLGDRATNGFPIVHDSHGTGMLVFGEDGTLLAACGDGASYYTVDVGNAPESYYVKALADGIIAPWENVGSYRSQLLDSHSGKILRLDPATGNGVPSNPYYDAAHPRSARSRLWSLGVRNPYRMIVRPGTGNPDPAAANPGVIYFGDVGWNSWEELSVATGPAQNFGWPIYEGFTYLAPYAAVNVPNPMAPNPLFGTGGCTQQFFGFRDLLKEANPNPPVWPNPCNPTVPIPSSIPRFVHTRPVLDWYHGDGPARTGIFVGTNASVVDIDSPASPVPGPRFGGVTATGGTWYQANDFPNRYKDTYFFGDYGGRWIRNVVFDADHHPVEVRDFATGVGGVVFMTTHPVNGGLYYASWSGILRRIYYVPSGNRPPVAVATVNRAYGPSPLTVQFTGSESSDLDGQPLTYRWDFGDGSDQSSATNPVHTFTAPAGVPTTFTISLVVEDSANVSTTNRLIVSVNNTPPVVTITSPTNGIRYPLTGQTTYPLAATITDAEHSPSALSCRWLASLHHNEHTHDDPADTNCTSSITVLPLGCGTETYFFKVTLTVTDAGGLVTTNTAFLYPDCPRLVPTVTWNNPSPITEGTPLNGAQLNATASVPGTFIYQPPAGTVLPVGNRQILAAHFTPTNTATYAETNVSVLINVRPAVTNATNVLVAHGAIWKYKDDGSDQGTAWEAPAFDDTGWTNGPSELGYGDGDEATQVSFGPEENNKHITTYFRHAFPVRDAAAYGRLDLRVLRDDGVVVYLNGTEVWRDNVPTGVVAFDTTANTSVRDETAWHLVEVSPGVLRDGTNVVAAELHQASRTSSDISFDLELIGVVDTVPMVTINSPTNNANFTAPADIEINATASDASGTITLIEFFQGATKLGELTNNPARFTWLGVPPGDYTLTAIATDNSGLSTASAPIDVHVAPSGYGGATNALLAPGRIWKYLDDGSDQGTAWRARAFHDATWKSGRAQLGYGDGDEATVVSFGPNANQKHVTTYFRRGFAVKDAAAFRRLTARLLRDDGAVVYLNGTEVFRNNLPEGPIRFETLALGSVTNENEFLPAEIDPALLVDGTNVVAVEVHQANRTSTDLSFDFELFGVTNAAPTVALISPTNFAEFVAPAMIRLEAAANDTDGTIRKVEFFQGATKLGEATNSPYRFTWSSVPVGHYALSAVATDDVGRTGRAALVLVSVNPLRRGTTNTFVPAGAVWRFLDDGSDQGAAWTLADFADAAWSRGPAQLGYGDFDEVTLVSYGPDPGAKPITTYFRHIFSVSDAASYRMLQLDLWRDDGAVVYLNGTEVVRDNLPEGPIFFDTPALMSLEHTNENERISFEIDPALLIDGNNVLAVEIHQSHVANEDLSFDLELTGVRDSTDPNPSPEIALTSPARPALILAPANVALAASVAPNGERIEHVEFFSHHTSLHVDPTVPYRWVWTNAPDGLHRIMARARTASGLSVTSATVDIRVGSRPPPPGELTAVAVSAHEIRLNWSQTAAIQNGFEIERSNDGRAYELIAGVGAPVTMFTDDGLRAGTTYFYRVRATNDLGESPSSNVASARTQIIFIGARINFQPTNAPIPTNYVADYGETFGDRGNGLTYGWNTPHTDHTVARGSPLSPDTRYDTLIFMQHTNGDASWEIEVLNGFYSVTLVAGDSDVTDDAYEIYLEDGLVLEGRPTADNRWIRRIATVRVTDGRLTLGNGPGAQNNKLCFLDIAPTTPAGPPWIRRIVRPPGGDIRLSIDGVPGQTYRIEGSTDLRAWSAITNVPNANGLIVFREPEGQIYPYRFFRLVSEP